MNLPWSARCTLALLVLQLASACTPETPDPTPGGDTTAPTTRATPAGGTFSGSTTVALACDDAGGSGCAATHYTLDGSEPSRTSPLYREALTLSASTVLRFFSVDKAGNAEALQAEVYTLAPGGADTRAPTTSATPPGGFYAAAPSVVLACDDGTGSGCAAIHYTLDGSEPTRASPRYSVPLALSGTTVLKFFSVDAADNAEPVKAQTYTLDAQAPTTVATPAGGASNSARTVALECSDGTGSGCVATYYTLDGSTPTAQSPRYTHPLPITASTVLTFFSVDRADNAEAPHAETYVIDTTAPTVVADPAGRISNGRLTVTLSCADTGGTGCEAIHFTTDGATPTTASAVYAAPLALEATTTLRFFALDRVGNASAVGSAHYLIDAVGPGTRVNYASGAYNATLEVVLTCDDTGGSGCEGTWYTTNGAEPTRASTPYTGPFPLSATTALKFFSADKAGNEGPRGGAQYTLDFQAPTTTASPQGGRYATAQQVTLSCADAGGSGCTAIYFTTDGSEPSATEAQRYTGPIPLSASAALKFFAVDAAHNREGVKTETYTIDITPPTTTASPRGGNYRSARQVTLTCSDGAGEGCQVTYYTTDGSTPTSASRSLDPRANPPVAIPIPANTTLKFYSVDATGNAEAVRTETYVIDASAPTTVATPGGGLYGGARQVTLACTDGPGGSGCKATYYTVDGSVPSDTSPRYTQGQPLSIEQDTVLRFSSVDHADNAEPVQALTYTIDTRAPVTTASPPGGPYNGEQAVTLTCVDVGGADCAGTWYTLDGSEPTTASRPYVRGSTIPIPASATLRFFSKDTLGHAEAPRTERYAIDTQAPTVSASPAGGNYPGSRTVTLSCQDGTGTGCQEPLWYTDDGSEPTERSKQYQGPLTVSASTVLKFFAKDAVGNVSAVRTERYVIDREAPTVSATPRGRFINGPLLVTLSCADAGGSLCKAIHFTQDGTQPSTSSTAYTAPIEVKATRTLRFLAVDHAGNTSPVSEETYTFDTEAPVVAADPGSRASSGSLFVTLNCTDNSGRPCREVRYTADASVPQASWSRYEAPLHILTTTTLTFLGTDEAGNTSAPKSATYLIDTEDPTTTADPLGGDFSGTVQVTLACVDAGGAGCAGTWYTTDGTDPVTSMTARYYDAAAGERIFLSTTTTLRFFSQDAAGNAETPRSQTYNFPGSGADTSLQIGEVRRAPDNTPVSLPVDNALVTYVKPLVGNATNDPAGFFLQAEQQGPAVFVAVDPASLVPAPRVGDVVSLVVAMKSLVNGQARVLALADGSWRVSARDRSVAGLLYDASAEDLITRVSFFESMYLRVSGTVSTTFSASGLDHQQASIITQGNPTSSNNLRLRLPTALLTVFQERDDLGVGCSLTVTAPLWRFTAATQVSAWAEGDLELLGCPAPRVVSAVATSATAVTVRFDRRIAPASVQGNGSGQFAFDGGLQATGATVAGTEVRLTTTAQTPGRPYTLVVHGSVTDVRGTGVDGFANSKGFTGFELPAVLRINEVAPHLSPNGVQRDIVELYVVQGGSTANLTLYSDSFLLATLPNVQVATGDIIVVHMSPLSTNGDAPFSETVSKSEYPAASYASNYDTAWDFHGNTAFINYNANGVLRLKDVGGATQDGVAFARTGVSTAGYLPLLQALQAEGLWQPASCGGALCTYATFPSAYDVSANWAGLSNSRATTVSRWANVDTDQRSDWVVGTGSLGQPNP
jgi:hypothetical protein